MPRIEALVTPSVMQWARESAGLSLEMAARKIGRPIEDIQGWEGGSLKPSLPQAREASKAYKRPLAVFYLPEPPKGFSTLRDFRSLPDDIEREFSSELLFLIRETQYRQQWIREFLISEGLGELGFVGSATIDEAPRFLAQKMLNALELSPEQQCSCQTRNEALKLWIKKTEEAGIFVFRQGKFSCKEVRGFVLCDPYTPFIFLNSKDGKAAQIFTLAHELAHLWVNQSGISNLEHMDVDIGTETSKIEMFCNSVAAEAVLDASSFDRQWGTLNESLSLQNKIENMSKVFKISEEVVARRLLQKKLISRQRYQRLRDDYRARWREFEQKEKIARKKQDGGPSYYLIKIMNNGRAFTQTILTAYYNGTASGREASTLLGAKINHLGKIAEYADFPTPLVESKPG